MVVPVEPGIYIPDLRGFRIEDDILLTGDEHTILTNAKWDLILI